MKLKLNLGLFMVVDGPNDELLNNKVCLITESFLINFVRGYHCIICAAFQGIWP